MAIKVGGTTVINDSKQYQNLTGIEGNYTNLQPTPTFNSTISGTYNPQFNRRVQILTLTGAWTCQEINSGFAGAQITIFVDTSPALYDITFSDTGSSEWHFTGDTEPDWTTARYWQIVITQFTSTLHMVSATSWGNIPGTANTTENITAGSVSFGTQIGIHHMSPSGPGYTKTYNGTGGLAYGYSSSQAEGNANLDGDYAFVDYTSSLIITNTTVTGDQLTTYGYSDSTGWAWRHWGQGTDEEYDITPPDITYTHTEAGLQVDSETGIGSLGSWNGQYTSDSGTVWKVEQILWCNNTRTSGTFPGFTPYNGSDITSGDAGNWLTISLRKISGTYGTTDASLFKSIQIGSLSRSRSDGNVEGNGTDFVSVCWNGGTTGGMTDTDITGGPGASTGTKTLKIYTE